MINHTGWGIYYHLITIRQIACHTPPQPGACNAKSEQQLSASDTSKNHYPYVNLLKIKLLYVWRVFW